MGPPIDIPMDAPMDAPLDVFPDPFPPPDPIRFPNTRRRISSSATATGSSRPSPPDMLPADPDTCRICRGESDPNEPLFYPCKCSGSIKYVHQDCLMEWLSHSQKKHCELCKTPFRFTKLYDPDMPKALPTHIFVSHTTKYLLRNLLVWMRAALVANIWLAWLPYLMRSVWSFLFWISDEGLGGAGGLGGSRHAQWFGDESAHAWLQGAYGTNTCLASPLFAATTSAATIGGVMDGLTPESARLVKGPYGINLTSTDPVYATILRLLFGTVAGLTEKPASLAVAAANGTTTTQPPEPHYHDSLLSGVGFLRCLTRHASVNRALIAILEGQVITVLVIVCFILIILVRDYVVQQQPEINMRAAFAAMDNQQPAQAQDDPAQVEPDIELDFEPPPPLQQQQHQHHLDPEQPFGQRAAPEPLPNQIPPIPAEPAGEPRFAGISPGDAPQTTRPIQDFDRSTVNEYLGIYREAGGDPEKILEIARERHLEARLDYWMRLTRSMMDRRKEILEPDALPGTPDSQPGASGSATVQVQDLESGGNGFPSYSPAEDVDVKGKGKFVDVEDTLSDDTFAGDSFPRDSLTGEVDEAPLSPFAIPLRRPRANTDGPPIHNTINPLANNSWSFADLPPSTNPDPYGPWIPEPSSSTAASAAATATRDPLAEWFPEAPRSTAASSLGAEIAEALDLLPDVEPLPRAPTPDLAPAAPRDREGLAGRVADFMWREVDGLAENELAPVNYRGDFAEDEPDDEVQGNAAPNPAGQDREAAAAAAAAGLDAEAIEDAEDLEGILELLGMRGPVAGLFQNAIFCAFLVSVTVFLGIFIPYNFGRIAIWATANPKRLARMLFSFSKFVQDCGVLLLGLASSAITKSAQVLGQALMPPSVTDYSQGIANASWAMTTGAARRIGGSFVTELPLISASEMRNFSAISHEALHTIAGRIASVFSSTWQLLVFVFSGHYPSKGAEVYAATVELWSAVWAGLKALPAALVNPSSWVLNLSLPEPTKAIDPELAHWSGVDRFWAILAGYAAMSLCAGLYLRRGTPLSTTQAAQDWEASLIDGLNQASGVMKVILIISIEMLVFPLYCGMLLDLALLPLFDNATLKSRLVFTLNYPVTSIFVHWFIGTAYMFHFALFVAMCRKIMRRGVLYFIRDPDDPEFHPVRDVLERNVTTQLRKILFSAFVYGALVVVCLGGVVWSLALSLQTVLPIHYSSNEPVLEFPIDLLFYNFLMPWAVKYFKPLDSLHVAYTWWFRRCARALRITWFLFGERRIDEEGQLALKPESMDWRLPYWRRQFLEINSSGKVVARSWRGIFEGDAAKRPTVKQEHMMLYNARKRSLVRSGQLILDGRFVRTPASDQVKIPKGTSVFLEVSEHNTRLDELPDRAETDLYSTTQYEFVYVPPHFRVRVFLFILFIWIFAAVTGVSITIVPLVFGRWMFKRLIPPHIRTNDIYAFSVGIHILRVAAYALFHAPSIYAAAKEQATGIVESVRRNEGLRRLASAVSRTARVVYTYFFVLLVFPLLVASLMELYALLPLHEVMYSALLGKDGEAATPVEGGNPPAPPTNPRHTVRIVQSWTIGLLYLKLATRVINTWWRGSRVSNAARAVIRRGWLDPDAGILTRSFVVPALAVWVVAVAAPLGLARAAVGNGIVEVLMKGVGVGVEAGMVDGGEARRVWVVLVYRLSFPATALLVVNGLVAWSVVKVFRRWQVRIRDEVYLIGERLHNFGGMTAAAPRGRGGWAGGAARL
ncbi:hypothetical protein C8A05DRAFT_14833 [Staphylotrichum tortipilum]|uniref:RING-type E3 ubiquitin transferase n=1 Tax=Staphylotrichum tortipilum TaxID=2831512 RepID=A0AAN6MNH6_9PEZI|nr:hypothetical protein C8A05DRAFT_14833 [Staphylotrichum longicolle]